MALARPSSVSTMLAGFVEGLEVDPNFIFVQGWIELSGNDDRHDLLISSGDATLGSAEIFDVFDRPDLSSSEASRKAFRCLVSSTGYGGDRPLVTRLTTAARSVELPQLNPTKLFEGKGELENVAGWGITGWLWDPRGTRSSIQIDQSAQMGLALTEQRDDLPPAFASTGQNGFRLTYHDLNALARASLPNFAILDGEPHTIRLYSGEHVVASIDLAATREYRGKVERYENGIVSGWACSADGSEDSPLVDICVDGARYTTSRAHFDRTDLLNKGFVKRGGGFRAVVHGLVSPTAGDREIRVLHHLTGRAVPGASLALPKGDARPSDLPDLMDVLPDRHPGISIIIPVYNAAQDLRRCLESVTQHTTMRARLIVIDDASPDPQVRQLLQDYAGADNVTIVLEDLNKGFTRTVNQGIALAGTDDVVFLNSDTLVGPRWLENLYLAAYHRPRVATATPLSDNAGAFSVPEIGVRNHFPAARSREEIARLIAHASAVDYPEVPTGNGFCMYVKRACIDRIGALDEAAFPFGYGEENDFCQRAQRHGFTNVVDDRTLVYHVRSASFGEQKAGHYAAGRAKLDGFYPEYRTQIRVFESGPAFLEMRWRVRKHLREGLATPAKVRPRFLFVIATQTGGTPQTNRDLMGALEDECDPHLLRCTSREIFLDRYEKGADVPLARFDLRHEVGMSLHTSSEYDRLVGELLVRHAIELVHIRHIAWHSLNLIRLCHRLSIPVVFSFHDFYTVCPNTKLLDENGVHCAGVCTPTVGPCQAELWPPAAVPPLKHNFVRRWRDMLGDVLQLCDAFVTTAESAGAILRSAFPDLGLERKLTIIPHGRSFDTMRSLAAAPEPSEPLRVLVPGNISGAKGASLIADIVELDGGATVEFHVLGDGGKLRAAPGLVMHGTYNRDDIGARIEGIRPHIGAVLSIWPETYCHTLSEMWACGVPVIGFQIGAVGERLTETGAGWTLPLGAAVGAVLEELREIRSRPDDISNRTERVVAWQRSTGRDYGITEMAKRYQSMYKNVIDDRKAFCIPNRRANRL